MKKSLLVLTAALAFGMAAAQTEAPASAPQVPALTDVPAGHWAKDAIDRLVSQGIILGYPDGTYRGTQNLTRYEAAVIIARLLDQVRTGEVPAASMDAETLTALQNAIQELAADLAALGVRVSDLEENAVSRDDFTRLENRVEELAAAGTGAAAPAGDAEAIANIQAQIDDLTARADDYDTLRADVDDNASSIAALNDLTVLLNQDILNLQDRTSAIEAAQADLVQKADFDTLSGRVGTVEGRVTKVETSVGDLTNRVTQLEKYAFSLRPSLSATYYVARGTRDMDFDRLVPGTVFSTGDDGDGATADTSVDWADLTGGRVLVSNTETGFYGFSTATATRVNKEGNTSLSFGISFDNAGKIDTVTSGATGVFAKSAGSLNVNKIDLTFGVQAGAPSGALAADGRTGGVIYPDVVDGDTVYRPLFFFFKQGTAAFTVGNAPVTVTFGKALKFKFSDYLFDNDKTGRGDGYIVNVDGSTVPVIGAYKPTITVVYGSRNGSRDSAPVVGTVAPITVTGLGGDGAYKYYRGVRATITPIGTLKAGLNYAQEGLDQTGYEVAKGLATGGVPANPTATPPTVAVPGGPLTVASDVTAFGADLHGTVAGWQIDSEFAQSRVTTSVFGTNGSITGTNATQRAFYGKVAGTLGPVKIYDANYRNITAGYDKVASISEANPADGDNGSTAPYHNDQNGFGVKIGGALGPVALGAYYDRETNHANTAGTAIVDRGAAAKVNLFNLVTVRGGYYEYLKDANAFDRTNAIDGQGKRYSVRGDITPGFGLAVGAYYNYVAVNGARTQSDNGLFRNSKYNSYFGLADNSFLDSDGCGVDHPGLASSDTDGVGGALNFSLANFSDKNCYTEYGAELSHNGKDASALVKNLSFRVGYAARYRNATNSYSNGYTYGDILYGAKLGIAQVDVKGAFGVNRYAAAEQAIAGSTVDNSTAAAIGVKVVTDQLNVIFKPSLEGQVGYYTRSHDLAGTAGDYRSNALKYLAGVKLNEFLLPNTKLAVYYAGYQGTNRSYVPFVTDTAGKFVDQNNGGATVRQDLLYVEGNYYDLSFGYGVGNLRLRNGTSAAPADARGQVFKIAYKVNF